MENNEKNNVELEQNVEEVVETTEEVKEVESEPVQQTVVAETPIMPTPEKVSNDTSLSDKNECYYKPNFALLVAVTLLAVGSVIGVLLYYINSTPSLKFMKVINSAFAEVENALDDRMKGYKSEKASVNFDIEATSNDESLEPVLDILNGLDFALESAVDYENSAVAVKLETEYNEKDLLNLDAYVKGKKAWIDSEGLLEDPLYTELDEAIELNTDKEQIAATKEVVAGIRRALNKAVKSDYITKEKNGKYTDYTMTISGDEHVTFMKDIINVLKSDQKFVSAAAKLGDVKSDEIIDGLDTTLDDLENPEADTEYPDTVLTFTMDGNDLKEITLAETIDAITLKFKAEIVDDETINFELDGGSIVSATGYLKTQGDDNNVTEELYIKVTSSGMEVAVKLNTETSVEYDVKVTNTLSKNSVNVEDLTDDEETAIMTRLIENEALIELMTDIEAITGSSTYDYEDNCYDGTNCTSYDDDYYSDDDYYYYE